MTGLFTRLRSLFSATTNTVTQPVFNRSNNTIDTAAGPSSAVVSQPSTFSMSSARDGFYHTLFGNIDDQKPLSTPQKLARRAVVKSLNNREHRVQSIPRLPSVIPKLLQRIRDPDAALNDYVNIINKDPALSTAVLKLANSVYFNPTGNRVDSIDTAVVKLGEQGLRSVLSAAIMQPVIQRGSHYYSEFGHKLWIHSLHCAVACEIIASQRGLEPFKGYLLGLVHDIGKITIFSELSTQFEKNRDAQQPGYAAFAPMMQTASDSLSYTVAKDWELPVEICAALKQQIKLKIGDLIAPYAYLLYQANLACELYAIASADADQYDAAQQALEDIDLPADLFAKLDSIAMNI